MSENCHVEPQYRTVSPAEYKQTEEALLTVAGMGCSNCAARVRNSLISLYGVTDATVDQAMNQARVTFNAGLVDQAALVDAVARAGNGNGHSYRVVQIGR